MNLKKYNLTIYLHLVRLNFHNESQIDEQVTVLNQVEYGEFDEHLYQRSV